MLDDPASPDASAGVDRTLARPPTSGAESGPADPAPRPDMTLQELANPPLIALGLSVVFLLALLVAVVIGSDAETASADEQGAVVVTQADGGVHAPGMTKLP